MQLIKKNFLKKIYFIFQTLNNLNIKIRLIYIKMDFTMNLTNLLKNIKTDDDKIYFNDYYQKLNKYIEIESTLVKINEDLLNLIQEKYNKIILENKEDKKQEKILYKSYNELSESVIKIHEDMLNNKINFIKLVQLYKK
jgi:hypothetical protein